MWSRCTQRMFSQRKDCCQRSSASCWLSHSTTATLSSHRYACTNAKQPTPSILAAELPTDTQANSAWTSHSVLASADKRLENTLYRFHAISYDMINLSTFGLPQIWFSSDTARRALYKFTYLLISQCKLLSGWELKSAEMEISLCISHVLLGRN